MPSLEQLGYETFADAVERATSLSFPLRLFYAPRERLYVRIQTVDNRSVYLALLAVDLYSNKLEALGKGDTPIHFPLSGVKAVWRRRRKLGRSLTLFAAPVLTYALVAAALPDPGSPRQKVGAAGGALIGAFLGYLLLRRLDGWEPLYEWELLYERAAA
jgi:hypothetical protein